MTSFDPLKNFIRIYEAENLEEPDQVPVSLMIGGFWGAEQCGVPQIEYMRDPYAQLRVQRWMNENLYNMCGYSPDVGGTTIWYAPFGSKIHWREDGPPIVKPILKDIKDIDNLKVPDPLKDGLGPKILEMYKFLLEHVEDKSLVGLPYHGTDGPVDIAAVLRGAGNFFSDIIKNPEYVHRLLKITTEFVIRWLKTGEEMSGVTYERVSLYDDFCGFMSPLHFKEFALPYFKKIFDVWPKAIHYFHCDAPAPQISNILPEFDVDAYLGFHPSVNLEDIKREIGDKICLVGNIDPLNILLRGSPDDVLRACKHAIDVAAPGGGYILSPGGEVSRGTPLRNLKALIKAASTYGRYH